MGRPALLVFGPLVIAVIIILCASGHCDSLPDAPSAQRPHIPAQAATCGPKWLGGCYVYGQGKTNMETLKDPYFLWPTIAQLAVTGTDMAFTAKFVDRSKGCFEANHDLGADPSIGRIVWVNVLIEGTVIGFRFAAAKAIPLHPQTKVQKVARWIGPAMAARSVQVHATGVARWLRSGCV